MKNKFRVILAERKLKISDVYFATGIAKTTLYGLYHEKTKNPDTSTIMRLCKYLEITPNEFFGIDNNEKEA
ncbi:TPA: helix-turn-helix transcriptional regulator [Staphylococcus aureus]|uniref:helix-turn-helix domain-containing protein n=1 Tax=Staphylococcus aureus TaxID=1280 RepID=UPI000CD216A5|nr:helix-turn-helix transcriptional regulator [Staphylococcus aureus]AVS03039.1 XRE family transcriptional regulator [Staphylococcus aureus]EGQ0541056.1 helix-turn-helix transcriptional regulator [Staphylococcus aureus]UXT29852.1 helix-turn-helix transcriptional regulator [Staphylococcus aureus]CAC6820124.1 pathogenicity island protein [Staphylococcus aureus]HBH9967501.1 helix-turn-helix transcriptional regulator [Staphylococcus aureus]